MPRQAPETLPPEEFGEFEEVLPFNAPAQPPAKRPAVGAQRAVSQVSLLDAERVAPPVAISFLLGLAALHVLRWMRLPLSLR